MTTYSRHYVVTETATKPAKSWTNKEIVAFHAFNPNGLANKFLKLYDTISQYEEAGVVKGSFMLIHYSYTYYEILMELAKKQRVSAHRRFVAIKLLNEQIDTIYNALGDAIMEAA